MTRFRKLGRITTALLIITALIILPIQKTDSVKPIEMMEEKLMDISAEELAVLERLFSMSRRIEEMKREEAQINLDIDELQLQINEIQVGISRKQMDYDLQLEILEKVLVNYQRGGPGSYIEILLRADNLSKFLKGLNVLRDLSRNVGSLLSEIEDGRLILQAEKAVLDEKAKLLDDKKAELVATLRKTERLMQEQANYLASLQGDMAYYQSQLLNIEQMWADSKIRFSSLLEDIKNIIDSEEFANEMDANFNIISMQGRLEETTFNRFIKERSRFPDTVINFRQDKVVLEFPDRHLVLTGKFVIVNATVMEYQVTSGTFYKLPLDQASIKELFLQGPIMIDFKSYTDPNLIIDFSIRYVQIQEGTIIFQIKPELGR